MEFILLWGFYILTFYAFLPGIISRLFGFRVFQKGRSDRNLALTFDDGPDPVYTPQLLDLLKKYNAKATFFVVGIHAEKYPELLTRMHEEGHLIGIHNYVHKSNWLMRPKTVKRQISKTSDIIESVTGKRATYYRPPWGIVNLFDYGNLGHLQIILWSVLFGDWRKKVGVDRLYKRMMKRCRGGEVLLLHDCGLTFGADREAPANMLAALERFLLQAKARDLQCIRIDELIRETDQERASNPSWLRRGIVRMWFLYERAFHLAFGLKTTNCEDPVFHFRVRPYHGKSMMLDDGIELKHDDLILELHFDNRRLYDIGRRSRTSMQLAIQMIRSVEKTLPELAEYVLDHPELRVNVKALYGVSMINRGPEQFGFTVRDMSNGLFSWMTKKYLRLLMSVIHPQGKRRLRQHAEQMIPKVMTMSVETLIERYGKTRNYTFESRTADRMILLDQGVENMPHPL
ncbi:polysaccharide deacetylase family protein [Paenibacillus apiarius]|uniref:polysaccharide deacetylase family protein n=1 Tax=Paenibacillus apiarius TaxID=46240 RepID=UPI0019822D19|nr:polysaccharide deacetylase family protein [Paenibacillus apiarius]MBN3525743.1 polysaccharide deacetylase family protein [Paenibacillus apiarius]